ncbi:serine/threonine-protein kinase [Paludisphaera mucosa]|uniref:Protein kinase n=1 Tax=Paludisphaera mucosa TaxID=3030827 RepID=A0ABT6FHG3_9BACT|nr:serine/threonine-protein kinase [Paludisphaera mucosa]MDG3006979.1 protein kinase [Paludisphaera mucosa]
MMAESESTNGDPYRFRIGSYGILHPLGTGGMSSVYRAVHLETGHEVALKVLPTAMARNSTVLKRFVAEARSAESLQHPNIVQIYDRGSDDGRYYLVLEYINGGDLHEYVQHQGPLPAAEAVGLVEQVVRGLEYAASRGVIHRDVKPSNLLRTPLGEVKITDLGLALRPESEDERVTREGTTVGTVDYMAPEQARDSRATSFQSDIYSLGCTFHYLLTGLPPFPGGDITEKLTRHARTPPPDVRELRPDLPPALAAAVLRMLAKKPEDRFPSYAELLRSLRAIDGDESSVALVPIDEETTAVRPARDRGAFPVRDLPELRPNSSLPEISLAALAPEIVGTAPAGARAPGFGPSALPNLVAIPPTPAALPQSASLGPRSAPVSEHAWIVRCCLIGGLVIVLVIGMDLILRPFPNNNPSERFPEPSSSAVVKIRGGEQATTVPFAAGGAPDVGHARKPAPPPAPRREEGSPPAWTEPVDASEPVRPMKAYPSGVLAAYLPAWAREPIPQTVDGPKTVVRRASDGREPGAVASLRLGLDVPRGVVELADVGPFPIDDLRVPGESRLIRAQPGYRAVVRIEAPGIDAVRALPGVFTLDGRSLILDSLDLVVNVRELGMNQRALFHGSGFQLTLRNCTVTIVNPLSSPFVFARSDDAAGRPSRIRIEDSLIRGDVASLFELNRGPVEVVALRSILAAEGPIVRTPDAKRQSEHRFFALGSAMGCRGPLVDLNGGPKSDAATRRLRIRAFDCVFGRFAGPGISSLTSSDVAEAVLDQQLDWLGANNLFAGWDGYFSSGPEHTIRSRSLAAFCSTWSSDLGASREQPLEWPEISAIADVTASGLKPFLPGWEELIAHVAQPRPFLMARTLLDFRPLLEPTVAPPGGPIPAGAVELTFDADAASTWNGDLGAFLRDHGGEPGGRLRVRVSGSGSRPFTPVRFPAGATVEIVVEKAVPAKAGPRVENRVDTSDDRPAGSEKAPLIFTPVATAQGDALLALEGGCLSLAGLRFRVEDPSRAPALIRVDDGSLAMHRCELIAPRTLDQPPPTLISFRAATTRPRPSPPPDPPIVGVADRPVCLLTECVLATSGDALRIEIGLGRVALSQCVVAARGDAFTLIPARVARSRFAADLTTDRCTVATARAAVRMSAWPGESPGPDRPWVISSKNTAFVDLSDRTPRESVLFRADPECFAQGQAFWRQNNDAIEVFGFAAAGEAPLPNRTRDVFAQWVDLWGRDHVVDVTGPRPGATSPSVRLIGRPRPGRIEAVDLLLDPNHHVGRPRLSVGADPSVFDLGRRPVAARLH